MKYLVNEDGEVIESFGENQLLAKIDDGDRVIKKSSIEYLLGTVPVKFNKFIKINETACKSLYHHGNALFSLFNYVGFADGILVFSNGRKVRPKHLASVLRKKRYSGSKTIIDLIKLDVIHKHKEGRTYYYTMNPYICIKGNRITRELYDEFKNTEYRKVE